MNENWRSEELRRGGNWTWWKEILGTGIAVLTICVPCGLALLGWGNHVENVLAVSAQRLTTLEMQRTEIAGKLDRISDKIDHINERMATEYERRNK